MKTNQNTGRKSTEHGTTDHGRTEPQVAALWWGGLSASEKALAMHIGRLMEDVEEGKRLEIRRERAAIRVRFIHILKQPEPGCVSAILLPEAPRGSWR